MSTRRLLSIHNTKDYYDLSYDEEADALEKTLDKISKKGWWLWFLFLLASIPGIINGSHLMSYVFLSHTPTFWCEIDELVSANWTNEEIIRVSTPGGNKKISSCLHYKWNYTYLVQLGYRKAANFTFISPKPNLTACSRYSYDEPVPKSTIVSEWDLVCERSSLHSNAQVILSCGKFVGYLIFGFFADRFGRKKSFVISSFLYMIFAPAAGFAKSYLIFIVARFFIGFSASGVHQSAYIILTEIAVKNRRTFFSCAITIAYPVGYIWLALCALHFQTWKSLQFVLSLPTLVFLFHWWFFPESPRWLLSQGRGKDAWQILCKNDKSMTPVKYFHKEDRRVECNNNISKNWVKRFSKSINELLSIFTTKELLHRILICYAVYAFCGLTYYTIALNADNFTIDRYLYVGLNGLVEAPSYILPLTLLTFLGRRTTSSVMLLMTGSALISILTIPRDDNGTILVAALFGKFCIAGVGTVFTLHTSEMFPTSNRNSAIGTCHTMTHIGSMLVPYIVEVWGLYGWYIPSTISGSLSLLSGLLILLLPETKDKPLMDSVQDLKQAQHQDRVSIKNCCYFT